jgi:hypothetical protein
VNPPPFTELSRLTVIEKQGWEAGLWRKIGLNAKSWIDGDDLFLVDEKKIHLRQEKDAAETPQ